MITKTIIKSYKYKVLPTMEQENIFAQWFGCDRVIYNHCANIIIQQFDNKEKIDSNFDLDKKITQLKKELTFLKNVNSQALQQTTKNVKKAIDKFFKDIKNGTKREKIFNFKKKYDYRQSINFPNYHDNFKFLNDRKTYKKAQIIYAQIPKLKSKLKVLKHRNWEGSIKNLTLSKNGDSYYLSVQTEQAITLPDNKNHSTIGVDVGIKKFVTTSNGEVFKPLNSFRKLEKTLARLQRKLARCVKKSNNFYRIKKKINKLHKKITNVRKDYLHKISTYLVNNHATIFVENLKINNMSKSAKGDLENHGKNVKQKSGLNKSILDQGWGMFFNQLKYKQEWKNQLFDDVKPHYSSQECCQCHSKHKENRLSQSKFVCNNCDNKMNADLNASFVIEYRGYIKQGLSHDEAQHLIDQKLIKKIKYTKSPWTKDVKISKERKQIISLPVLETA
jgi:putative transposase